MSGPCLLWVVGGIAKSLGDVRFTPNSYRESEFPHRVMSAFLPESGHAQCTRPCPLRANRVHR